MDWGREPASTSLCPHPHPRGAPAQGPLSLPGMCSAGCHWLSSAFLALILLDHDLQGLSLGAGPKDGYASYLGLGTALQIPAPQDPQHPHPLRCWQLGLGSPLLSSNV
jgi:hypothetical protein